VKVSLNQLKLLLQQNVVELKFARRRPQPGEPLFRRMLCTNSYSLLNSTKGRVALNYRPPHQQLDYSPELKGLVVTWDIFEQDYRQINVAACQVVATIKANDEFWKYYNEKLAFMTEKQKIDFMRI
jgi:hypothetical protein